MSEITKADVLRALGIETGVTYTVVQVHCTEKGCIYNPDCQDNAVGLTDRQKGCFMDCHDYKTAIWQSGKTKRVYWKRGAP